MFSLTVSIFLSIKFLITWADLVFETCSAFANWVCKKAGLIYSGKLNAKSWLNVGYRVTKPKLGDIVVFSRGDPKGWQGHVAFFIRKTPNWIYVLGGNQNNQVKISAYPKHRLLEYRRL